MSRGHDRGGCPPIPPLVNDVTPRVIFVVTWWDFRSYIIRELSVGSLHQDLSCSRVAVVRREKLEEFAVKSCWAVFSCCEELLL